VTFRRPRGERDSGAALLLAIGFVLGIGSICGGLAALATSSVNNRRTLEVIRDREFAADGVIENAITQVRLLNCASAPAPIQETLNQVAIRVDWANACGSTNGSDGVAVAQRNVIFMACLDTGSACTTANVIIRAQVNFEPSSGPVTKTYVQSWNVNR
jgi:hypothetical protein